MLFRMTKRLRDWLKVADRKPLLYNDVQPDSNKEWYCNLFVLHRRRCLLLTHSTTLFSFLIAGVRQADVRDFGNLFRSHATAALTAEGISVNQIAYLLDAGPDQIGKTENRSVLGSMNDLVHMCRFYASQAEDWTEIEFNKIGQHLNEAPMSYIEMESAARALKTLLKSTGVE